MGKNERNLKEQDNSILSETLREQLKQNEYANSNVMLVCSKKTKAKKRKRELISKEVQTLAIQMSKKKQKKLKQLQERKDKAARRSSLVAVLKEAEIENYQLDLLQSSKVFNPQLSSRQLATIALKKHRAGLALSQEEKECLFWGSGRPFTDKATVDANVSSEPKPSEEHNLPTKIKTKKKKDASGRASTSSVVPSESHTDTTAEKQAAKTQLVVDERTSSSPEPSAKQTQSSNPHESAHKRAKQDLLLKELDAEFSKVASHKQDSKNLDIGLEPDPAKDNQQPAPNTNDITNNILKQLAALKKTSCDPAEKSSDKKVLMPLESAPAAKKAAYVPKEVSLPSTAEAAPGMGGQGKHTVIRTKWVEVQRSEEIQAARMQLPVCGMEQEIVESINDNDVIVLCGETGSGKSTQVPQFLYEAGYCRRGLIGATQPRRVAAVSTAHRVAHEMATKCGLGGYVAYQIRHDSEGVTKNTKIKFMTDGILLQEISQDLLLRKYSAIILDEAHERNLNTDVLLGMISRSIPLRKEASKSDKKMQPLKLIIMSATLRVEDFTQNSVLFPHPPPIVKVAARQYPVTVHFNKRTELQDYLGEAFRKTCKIHSRLPEGGILVFLTGQREILFLCQKLEEEFNRKRQKGREKQQETHKEAASSEDSIQDYVDDLDALEQDAEIAWDDLRDKEDTDSSSGSEEDVDLNDTALPNDQPIGPVCVLPLFAMLPPEQQTNVFKPPPSGHRLIVVATNVAETSVTIPGIKYVIDCGRAKSRVLNHMTGVSQFEVGWISQASADQRAGRAGRTGPGHCYRLFSTAVYLQQFEKFAEPEVKTRALEDIVLQMKAMGILNVESFPFPTPPDSKSLRAAVKMLQHLGAIDSNSDQITALGKSMATLPIGARFSKMIVVSQKLDVFDYALALVSMMGERAPFLGIPQSKKKENAAGEAANDISTDETLLEAQEKQRWREVRSQWHHPSSDGLALLKAMGAYAFATGNGTCSGYQFCKDNLLHQPTMDRAVQLHAQINRLVHFKLKGDQKSSHSQKSLGVVPPGPEEEQLLKKVMLSGLLDCVAKRASVGTITEGGRYRRRAAYLSCNTSMTEPLYIHPESSVYSKEVDLLPKWVCYQSVIRSQGSDMLYMVCVTAIEPSWLAEIAQGTPLISFSEPLPSPCPKYVKETDQLCCYVIPRFGVHAWELGAHLVPISSIEDKDFSSRWVARLMLEGKVITELRVLTTKKMLNDSPVLITAKAPKKKVALLLAALMKYQVYSLQQVKVVCSQNNSLFSSLSLWIKKEYLVKWNELWSSITSDW